MDFKDIYNEYSSKIYRFCLGYVNDVDVAKDLTQETFISVWENLNGFRNESGIGTWIFKIAANKCLRQLENEKRKQKLVSSLPFENVINIDESVQQHMVKQQMLRNCIAVLPETERLIIGLYLEDIPQDKIAEILGISYANIRVKVHRIKTVLSEQLKSYGQF